MCFLPYVSSLSNTALDLLLLLLYFFTSFATFSLFFCNASLASAILFAICSRICAPIGLFPCSFSTFLFASSLTVFARLTTSSSSSSLCFSLKILIESFKELNAFWNDASMAFDFRVKDFNHLRALLVVVPHDDDDDELTVCAAFRCVLCFANTFFLLVFCKKRFELKNPKKTKNTRSRTLKNRSCLLTNEDERRQNDWGIKSRRTNNKNEKKR